MAPPAKIRLNEQLTDNLRCRSCISRSIAVKITLLWLEKEQGGKVFKKYTRAAPDVEFSLILLSI